MPRLKPLSRRTLLRGLFRGVAVSLALPPLEAMFNSNGNAYACGGAIPKRFGLFFWGNGNVPERFVPSEEGSSWTLSDELASLAAVQSYLTVVSGMSVKIPNVVPHGSGAGGILSGASLLAVGDDTTFAAPSIDQLIAAEIGGDTLYPSVQTAASDTYGLSYTGPSSLSPAETDPYAFFERLFGPTFREPGEEVVVDPSLGLRRSVLDAVMTDISALRQRVGTADQARLDQHFEGLRELETRLARLEEDPPNLAACAKPTEPASSYPDIDGMVQVSARSRVMVDMLAMALACDQTRVFAHYLSEPVNNILYEGAGDGHHNLTHDESGDQPTVDMITTTLMAEFAYLCEKFAAVDEGDGSLLDNSVVLATSETSFGHTHSMDDMPILLAGSCCGALKTGLHYRSPSQENASKVHLSLLRALDINAVEFGTDEAWTDESLSDIEV